MNLGFPEVSGISLTNKTPVKLKSKCDPNVLMVYIYRSMKVAGLFFGAKMSDTTNRRAKIDHSKILKAEGRFFFAFCFGENTDPFPTLFGVEFPS